MNRENPCNICKNQERCSEVDCILHRIWNECFYCKQYNCFLNHEGDCALSLYDDCGSRKGEENEVL